MKKDNKNTLATEIIKKLINRLNIFKLISVASGVIIIILFIILLTKIWIEVVWNA